MPRCSTKRLNEQQRIPAARGSAFPRPAPLKQRTSQLVHVLSSSLGGAEHPHWQARASTPLVWQEISSEMEKATNKCRPMLSSSFAAMFLSSILLVHLVCQFAYANDASDTLLPGQSLRGNPTLVSKDGSLKLGFQWSDTSFGIWFTNPECEKFLVWRPDTDIVIDNPWSVYLSLSEHGSLRLLSNDSLLWSTDSGKNTSISAVAVLLDGGNLVIRDQANTSMVLWQSIDHPTDTLIPGGSLGFNNITGKNISLISDGSWALELDGSRSRGFIIRQISSEIISSGQISSGLMFAGNFPSWMAIREDGDNFVTLVDAHIYLYLDSSGYIMVFKLGECTFAPYSPMWSAPESFCDFDSYCGPYGLCRYSGDCGCPVGFDPPHTETWNTVGCSRKVPLNCEQAMFYPIDGIDRFPHSPQSVSVRSTRECEAACSSDCSCTAYAYDVACLLWFGELRNTIVLDSGSNGSRMYIRVSKQKITGSKNYTVVVLLACVLPLIVVGLGLLWRYRRKLFAVRPVHVDRGIVVFSYAQVKKATNKFSEKLGEGGFGYVFKGTLPCSTLVAVKKLKDLRQGEKQFRTEVQTIGMIQHINLVRLLGFCAEGSKRLLVYEYMENDSLNSQLFSNSSAILSWELRYRIAIDTARGLAYLHEECKDCIVHCDMKPDNVLLDAEFCPKIADFGMAKILGRDFSRALTTMRGTIGYLAPEWISGLPITHKADVYSYGMMLLEIVSGRRNREKIKEGKFTYFPIFAAVKVNEGDVMCLLDSRLEGNAVVEQLSRACRIACWCIQDAEDHRPTMGQVVHTLEGVMDVEVPPIPRSLQNYVGMEGLSYSPTGLDSF